MEICSGDGGSGALCKFCKRLPDYAASNPRRQFLKLKMLGQLPLFPFVISSVNDASSYAFVCA